MDQTQPTQQNNRRHSEASGSKSTAGSRQRSSAPSRGGAYRGRFLSDTPSAASVRRKKRRRDIRQRKAILIMGAVSVVLLLLSVVLVIVSCSTSSPIAGTWQLDARTSYQFGHNDLGLLILPNKEYLFTYTLDGDVLNINFKDEIATDSTYTYRLDGDTLTLTGTSNHNKGTYVLEKQD